MIYDTIIIVTFFSKTTTWSSDVGYLAINTLVNGTANFL